MAATHTLAILLGVVCTLSVAGPSAAADDPAKEARKQSASKPGSPSQPAQSSRTHPRLSGWQLDVHGGSMPAPTALTGTSFLPPPGPTFGTTFGNSQIVDSYYFGAGAALFNQAAATQPNLPANFRISPLDPVLTSASVARKKGTNFGVRIGHTITQYAQFEVTYDQNSGRLALSSDALNQIEAARSSFEDLLNKELSTLTGPAVTSVAQINDNVGNERLFTVTGSFNGGTFFGITPYFTAGAGVIFPKSAPSFTLTGHYSGTVPGAFPFVIDETDAVTVTYSVDPAVVQVLGGGVRIFLTSRIGAQIDYRVDTAKLGGGMTIKVATNPVLVQSNSPTNRGATNRGSGPVVQFSDTENTRPSSLASFGDNFKSFESDSHLKTTALTFAFFFRF